MHNLIPMRAYVDAELHERELATIRGAWHYAALRRDLMENRDWVASRASLGRKIAAYVSPFNAALPISRNTLECSAMANESCGHFNAPIAITCAESKVVP